MDRNDTSIELSKAALSAALICAATKDCRTYLNGVYVETATEHDGKPAIVYAGIDGYMLFAGSLQLQDMPERRIAIIIPRDVVKAAVKWGGKRTAMIPLRPMDGGRYMLGDTVFTPVDGRYPDFRRLIPAAVSGERADFNPDLLQRANDAMRAWHDSNYIWRLHMNGNGAAVMRSAQCAAVVMPMRSADEEEYRPFTLPAPMPEEERTDTAVAA